DLPAFRRHQVDIHRLQANFAFCHFRTSEEKSPLLQFILEKMSSERLFQMFGDNYNILHVASTPCKHKPTPLRNVMRLSPASIVAAGRQETGCQENQAQSPAIGAGPLLEFAPALRPGGLLPSLNLRSASTKKLSGPVFG